MFVGRSEELGFLNSKYNSGKAEFIVLYGRRRVGKTEILKQFSKNLEDVYFYICKECTDNEQLTLLSEEILSKNKMKKVIDRFESWDKLFQYIANVASLKRIVLIIDEFPYMIKENPSIASRIQAIWDMELQYSKVMIIVAGSAMSFIEDSILAHKNPLYGRTTGIYKMDKLNFLESTQFYKNFTKEELVNIYSILGGIPYYLKIFDDNLSIDENIKTKILNKGETLYNEVEFLLRQELRDVAIYYQIIEAIALGNTKMNDIFNKTQIQKNKISVYLNNLMKLNIIEREYPIDQKLKAKINSSSGLYKVKDNYFKFYFRYIYPYTSEIERGDEELVYSQIIANTLNSYTSFVFEDVCKEYLIRKNKERQTPVVFLSIGRYWDKDVEIDIVAKGSGGYILGECKWQNKEIGIEVLNELQKKGEKIIKESTNIYYYIFSKTGFKQELVNYAKEKENVILISLDEIL